MGTPTPPQPIESPEPPAPAPIAASPAERDRDLVTLGGLEAEFTELEHDLERVDRPGTDPAGAAASAP